MASPAATRRSKLDLAVRSLQPTQVRITGTPEARCSARLAIPASSLPRPRIAGVGQHRRLGTSEADVADAPEESGGLAAAQESAGVSETPGAARALEAGCGAASDLMSIRQPVS